MTAGSASKLPVSNLWFAVEPVQNGILRINEAWIDPYLAGDLWLIRGRDKDLLADTGTGIVSPRPVVEALARQPVLAVALNRWYDHAGGLHYFDDRGCHRDEAEMIANPTPRSSVSSIYVSEEMLLGRPYAEFTTDNYRMVGTEATVLFDDGDVIDLGDRQIEVIHVPGKTPGSIVLWEAKTGSLFSCDTLLDDPSPELRVKYGFETKPRDPVRRAARIVDLERLRKLPIRTVYSGHFGEISRDRALELMNDELAQISA